MRWVTSVALGSAIAAALVRLVGGCVVDDLSIAGKACPCVTGFRCDDARNVCVAEGARSAEPEAGSPAPDVAAPDSGVFVVQRFAPSWQTSRSIRWDWEVSGDPSKFAEYRLVVGGSEGSVRGQDSASDVFDRRLAPELGSFGGRDPLAPGEVARGWTVTDKHGVEKKIFARLIVRDSAGGEAMSEIVSATTRAENDSIVLFADNVVDGSVPTPSALKRVGTECYAGGGCLQLAKVECGDAAACELELGVTGFDNRSLNDVSAQQFDAAFVELAVRGGSGASARPHSDLVLTIGAPACRIDGNPCRFRAYRAWSMRPGMKEFRLLQFPLGTLQLETPSGPGRALTYPDLQESGFKIEALTIDGEWTSGATLGLDHGHVRW